MTLKIWSADIGYPLSIIFTIYFKLTPWVCLSDACVLCSPWAIVERATFPVPADGDPRAAAVPCCRTTTQLDDTCPLRRNIAVPLPYITPNHITIPSGHATTESSTFFCTHLAQSQLTSNNFKNTTIHNGMSLLLHLQHRTQ